MAGATSGAVTNAADIELAARAGRGEAAAVSRVLSEVERETDRGLALVSTMWRLPSGRPRTIGVTGAPGVGKSSLVSRLLDEYARTDGRPAVLAIDPSSERSGGSLLGDRIRMTGSAGEAFVRSLPNRAVSGGLAPSAAVALAMLARCGFDPVIVETVGVGQSEVAVSRIVGTTVTCLAPGLGDQVQAAKAGLMESADIFVITKADLPVARTTADQLRAMVNLGNRPPGSWRRPVCSLSARTGEGVADLVANVAAHCEWTGRHDSPRANAESLAGACVQWALDLRARRAVADRSAGDALRAVAVDVAAGRIDPIAASLRLWAAAS